MKATLALQGLTFRREGKTIFENLELSLSTGEVHVLSGANGAGKSSLLHCVAGHPHYKLESGQIQLNGENIVDWPPEKRAQAGIFLAFQMPYELEGLTVANFLRTALKFFPQHPLHGASATEFYQQIYRLLEAVGLPKTFTGRSVHQGFSGGEKKRFEWLQLRLLQPKFALLDEIDSGLDVDARQCIGKSIQEMRSTTGFLLVSHNQDFVTLCQPTALHQLENGHLQNLP